MKLLIAILLVAAGREPVQREERSPGVANILDALGLLQPESVQSILLLHSGKSLLRSKADELETALRKDPNNIDDRLMLIGYYTTNGRGAADRLRLRINVLLVIGNHPEHATTAVPSLR